MSANVSTFEIRVRQRSEQPIKILNWDDNKKYHKILKMFHIQRRTREQAIGEARKYGQVISCRKVDLTRGIGSIEKFPIENEKYVPQFVPDKFQSAIAMDSMIWKKARRSKRLSDNHKDKTQLDKE